MFDKLCPACPAVVSHLASPRGWPAPHQARGGHTAPQDTRRQGWRRQHLHVGQFQL